jgi:hypothetical protein
MPLVRYFFFVGAALLALLFVVDVYVPNSPPVERTTATANLSIIRIHSDRKWPERIVLDSAFPTAAAMTTRMTEAAAPAPVNVAEASAKPDVRQAFAQLPPSSPNQLQPADPRRLEPKPQRKRKIVARSYTGPPTMLVAQQPRFGLFGNAIW